MHVVADDEGLEGSFLLKEKTQPGRGALSAKKTASQPYQGSHRGEGLKSKSLFERVSDWVIGAAYAACLAASVPIGITNIAVSASLHAPKFSTEEEAKSYVEEKKKELGITEPVDLQVAKNDEFLHFNIRGFIGRSPNGNGYILGINTMTLDKIVIDHELYHVYQSRKRMNVIGTSVEENYLALQNDPNHGQWTLERLYCQEWQACLYAISGVKL